MTPEDLALMHQEMSRTLATMPKEQVLLWYADLGLEVQGQKVTYLCPSCGKEMRRVMEEFLERDSSADLRCSFCRGDVEERGGPMD